MCRRSPFLIRTQPYLIPLPKVWAKFAIYCARYHHVSHELENGSSEALLKELNELQLEIEAKDGWKLDAAVKQTLGELGLPENEKNRQPFRWSEKNVSP